MAMIDDVYSAAGTFSDKHQVAQETSQRGHALGGGSQDPAVRRQYRGVHPRPPGRSDLERDGTVDYVRVQVLTPAGVLDCDKRLGVVKELTEIVARAAGDPTLAQRTWVLLTASPEGGWGTAGHVNTQPDIAAPARAALSADG